MLSIPTAFRDILATDVGWVERCLRLITANYSRHCEAAKRLAEAIQP